MVQMVQGNVFPISKAQAISFVKMGCCLGALNSEDVRVVELLLKRHQLEGCYRYTQGKDFVKLINQCDLDKALQAEYGFKRNALRTHVRTEGCQRNYISRSNGISIAAKMDAKVQK